MSQQHLQPIDHTRGIGKKLVLISLLGLASLSAYLMVTSYHNNIALSQRRVLERLQSITKTLAPHIPTDLHQQVARQHTTKDAIRDTHKFPAYQKLHEILRRAQQRNGLQTPIYTIIQTPSKQGKGKPRLSFIATSAKKPYYRHPYDTAPRLLFERFDKGGMYGPYKDKHGQWLSAFSPLKDAKGKTLAILQADQKFDAFLSTARKSFLADLVISVLVSLLIGALLYFFVTRIVREFVRLFEQNTEFSKQLDKANVQLQQNNAQLQQQHQEVLDAMGRLKQAQNQLIQAEKMASLGRLVAGIAHEINTPIGIGVTAASALREKSNELQQRFLAQKMKKSDLKDLLETNAESTRLILGNLERAAALIQNFKQVAVDQTTEQRRSFEVSQYLSELMSSLRPTLHATQLTIELNFAEEITMESYPGALAQVLTNLVTNAVTHAYDKDSSGRLTIHTERAAEHLLLEVSDDGKGITTEDRKHIFDPFFTTKRNEGGTGLGLHIVYNIVTQVLAGTIRCESEPGVGTAFLIKLPLNAPAQASIASAYSTIPDADVSSKTLRQKLDAQQQADPLGGQTLLEGTPALDPQQVLDASQKTLID